VVAPVVSEVANHAMRMIAFILAMQYVNGSMQLMLSLSRELVILNWNEVHIKAYEKGDNV
jgi:hypothetical protein